jgi:hypothetical protein
MPALPTLPRLLLASAAAALLASCCPLAQYLCGPDRSRWVSESHETHAAAVATFLEAVRRDNVAAIYRSLSEDFKRRNVPGILEAHLAWQTIKARQSGVHLLGSARSRGWMRRSEDRVRYELEIHGRKVWLDVVRQPYVTVAFESDGPPEPRGAYVTDLTPYVGLRPSSSGTTVTITIPDVDLPDDLDPAAIRRVAAGVEWKIDDIAMP